MTLEPLARQWTNFSICFCLAIFLPDLFTLHDVTSHCLFSSLSFLLLLLCPHRIQLSSFHKFCILPPYRILFFISWYVPCPFPLLNPVSLPCVLKCCLLYSDRLYISFLSLKYTLNNVRNVSKFFEIYFLFTLVFLALMVKNDIQL